MTTVKQLKKNIASSYGIWMDDFPQNNYIIKGSKAIVRTSINMVNMEKHKYSKNPVAIEMIDLNDILSQWIMGIYEFHLNR